MNTDMERLGRQPGLEVQGSLGTRSVWELLAGIDEIWSHRGDFSEGMRSQGMGLRKTLIFEGLAKRSYQIHRTHLEPLTKSFNVIL